MTAQTRDLRVAFAHDFFTQAGGAERLVERMVGLFPGSTVFTSVLDPDVRPPTIEAGQLVTSGLQRLLNVGVPLKMLAPLMPSAFRSLNLSDCDVVVSSSAAFGHHVSPPERTLHVCYCHTPPPFLYRRDEYFGARPTARRLGAAPLNLLRRVDRRAARRVHRYLANSRFTANRIRQSYGIEAELLHPAIDTQLFVPSTERSGRFLVVSRLRPHKSIDLAIAAANDSRLPLDIIGDGSDLPRLRSLAGPTVRFLGRRADAEVAAAMARCVALVVPGIEDFGMVTAEVQAAGRPPIGFAGGGTLEIIDHNRTGFLATEQTAAAFAAEMRRAQRHELETAELVSSAQRFDAGVFCQTLLQVIDSGLCELRRSAISLSGAGGTA